MSQRHLEESTQSWASRLEQAMRQVRGSKRGEWEQREHTGTKRIHSQIGRMIMNQRSWGKGGGSSEAGKV